MSRRTLPDMAGALHEALASLEGCDNVEATYRRSGPISGAQSVVTLHTTSTDASTITGLLRTALTRCAVVLASSPLRGHLYLYCYDGDGMRHMVDEVDATLGAAVSFDRLAAREGLHRA